MSDINSQILSIIETSIKKGNADIKAFSINLISEIKKNNFFRKFQNFIRKKIYQIKKYILSGMQNLFIIFQKKNMPMKNQKNGMSMIHY